MGIAPLTKILPVGPVSPQRVGGLGRQRKFLSLLPERGERGDLSYARVRILAYF